MYISLYDAHLLFLCYFIVSFSILLFLCRRKLRDPVTGMIFGVFSIFFPPFLFIYLVFLTLKKENKICEVKCI